MFRGSPPAQVFISIMGIAATGVPRAGRQLQHRSSPKPRNWRASSGIGRCPILADRRLNRFREANTLGELQRACRETAAAECPAPPIRGEREPVALQRVVFFGASSKEFAGWPCLVAPSQVERRSPRANFNQRLPFLSFPDPVFIDLYFMRTRNDCVPRLKRIRRKIN
jgi:hypothetical protein